MPRDDGTGADPVAPPPAAAPALPVVPSPSSRPVASAFPVAGPGALDDLVPDTVLDGARFGSVAVRAVSQRGDDARQRGDVRGEAFFTARFGAGRDALLLVAVVVGLCGTGEAAHRAARHACAWAGDTVGRNSTQLAQDLRTGRHDALKAGLRRLTDRGYGKLRGRTAEPGAAPYAHPAALRCLLLPADPDCRTRVFFGVSGGGLFRLRDGGWEDLEPTVAPAEAYPAPAAYAAQDAADGRSDGLSATAPAATAPAVPAPAVPTPAVPHGPDGEAFRSVSFRPAAFRFRTLSGRPGDVLLLCGTGLAAPLSGDPDFAARLAAAWSVPGPPDLADFLTAVQPRGTGDAEDRTAVAVWES
ncbi:protein phosphatase 2C domain-containing protein [Streptomyces sp. NPDC058000]|uniref:protein phosphatase 2C domain-containing protein n=1 Tax=Streptomyces sp. NPDC058000 TaxID=3346299 RepID=UPI0036E163B9